MSNLLARAHSRIVSLQPWVALAIMLAAALAGYYAYLGVGYLSASRNVRSLEEEARLLATRVSGGSTGPGLAVAQTGSGDARLEQLRSYFDFPEADLLLAALAETGGRSSVTLQRVAVGARQSEVRGGIQFQVQPLSATLTGEIDDIYQFLGQLQQDVPAASVTTISLSGLEGSPAAQVQLLVYLSPRALSDDEEVD